MAPPKKPINLDQVFELAKRDWKNTEIASFFNISTDTLDRRCADIIKRGRLAGSAHLRDLQWNKAEEGSERMLIWLGKQRLGQRDQTDVQVSSVKPLVVETSTTKTEIGLSTFEVSDSEQ